MLGAGGGLGDFLVENVVTVCRYRGYTRVAWHATCLCLWAAVDLALGSPDLRSGNVAHLIVLRFAQSLPAGMSGHILFFLSWFT